MVATRSHILKLYCTCTKYGFGWSFAPDPVGAAYRAPPDSLAGY